jgi:hypothetical protein
VGLTTPHRKKNYFVTKIHKPRTWIDSLDNGPKQRKMDLGEIGWDGGDWIELAQDKGPVEGSCEHGNEPSGSLKLLGVF